MTLSREDAAKATGMKSREIVDIVEVQGGYRVTTHDGQAVNLEYAPEAALAKDPAAPPAPDAVPEGSEKEILDWVGEDRDRAGRALEREQGQDKPRKGLAGQLEKLVG